MSSNITKILNSSILFCKLSKIRSEEFELNYFKTLTDPFKILKYCKEHLDFIHQGTSRAAFVLTGRFVLKVALNKAGQEQNQKEYDTYIQTQFKDIITKVHDYEPRFYWIISDLVSPLSHAKSRSRSEIISLKFDLSGEEYDIENAPVQSSVLSKEQLDYARAFAEEQGFPFYEIWGEEQWGKTADGRMVLIDYGYDQNIGQDYRAKLETWIPEVASRCITGEASQEEFNEYILSKDAQDHPRGYPDKYFNRSLYEVIKDRGGPFFQGLITRIVNADPLTIDYMDDSSYPPQSLYQSFEEDYEHL